MTASGRRAQAKIYTTGDDGVDGWPGTWLDTFEITNFDGSAVPAATQICFDDYHPEVPLS